MVFHMFLERFVPFALYVVCQSAFIIRKIKVNIMPITGGTIVIQPCGHVHFRPYTNHIPIIKSNCTAETKHVVTQKQQLKNIDIKALPVATLFPYKHLLRLRYAYLQVVCVCFFFLIENASKLPFWNFVGFVSTTEIITTSAKIVHAQQHCSNIQQSIFGLFRFPRESSQHGNVH